MNNSRLSHYDTAVAHVQATASPETRTFTADGGVTGEAQYELAAAQVRATLAVADELRELREAVGIWLKDRTAKAA